MKSLEFRNLPLAEVAMKRFFSQSAGLSLASLPGLLRALEGRYIGRLTDLPELEALPGPMGRIEFGPVSLPGYAFLQEECGVSLAVQVNGLIAKWQRLPDVQYPGYGKLRKSMDDLCNVMSDVGMRFPAPSTVQLVYQSRLGSSFSDLGNPADWLFSFEWPDVAGEAVGSIGELQIVFKGVSGVDKRLVLLERIDESGGRYHMLQTVAGRRLKPEDNVQQCEAELHDVLCNWFPLILSDKARSVFGLERG